MTRILAEELELFSDWKSIRLADQFTDDRGVYVIRIVDCHGNPFGIQRAKCTDEQGIVNIGFGYGSSRLRKLQAALDLESKEDWNQSKHHQLMLWWLTCDFDSIQEGFSDRNMEVAWKSVSVKKAARKLEWELLWSYKEFFGDLPIGNVKT